MKEKMILKKVQLYPTDTYSKYGIIHDWNETGMVILITNAHEKSGYEVGKEYYFSHSSGFVLKFM